MAQDWPEELAPPSASQPELRRRVSRVESLRRLILGASHVDSRRLFDRKKQRYDRMAARAKVDKAIGTEADYSEEDLFDRSSSRFNMSCESFDLDSISQLSLADSSTDIFKASFATSKSISSDNIPAEVHAYPHRATFPHAFVRSKLAVLPEEQGTLTRRAEGRPGSAAGHREEGRGEGPPSLTLSTGATLQRKRSQSLADIQVCQLGLTL